MTDLIRRPLPELAPMLHETVLHETVLDQALDQPVLDQPVLGPPVTDPDRPVQVLFGLPVDPLTADEALALAHRAVVERRRLVIGVVNAAKVAKLKADALLRDSLLDTDVLLADGQSVVWASRLLRRPLPERVTGIDLFTSLLEAADRHGHRVYLLGATADVVAGVARVVRERWPGVVLVGVRDGYFTDAESAAVAAEIRDARPDLLFLGMTTPKKEIFLGTYGETLDVPVQHGVGGSFDILAGVTRRAPVALQRLGLEWAYRVVQEPRRLATRYLVTNLVFLALLTLELVRRHPRYPRPGTPTVGHVVPGARTAPSPDSVPASITHLVHTSGKLPEGEGRAS